MQTQTVMPVRSASSVSELLDETEISLIMKELFSKLDVPFRRSEPAPKTILIDFFGTMKAGKTKTTEKIEQLFRRSKMNILCPHETAEIDQIRNKSSDNPIIFQAKHLTGVQEYVLNLAQHRGYHAAIISRGFIDMLYWYEKGAREGLYSVEHQQSVRNQIYEFLRLDIVDAYIFLTCSVEAAMKREYEGALTQARGSKMTEKVIAETIEIYSQVLEGVQRNVPNLPIFHIDTSDLDIGEVAREVVRCLLPTLYVRFGVPVGKLLPHSLSLLKKEVKKYDRFEEQIKLVGWPTEKKIAEEGWEPVKNSGQYDIYLDPSKGNTPFNSSGEIIRIRREDGKYKFMYKSQAGDRLLSHRRPFTVEISEEESMEIMALYPKIAELTKTRWQYKLGEEADDGHFFTLHIDNFGDKGAFTEIRALGSSGKTHTMELKRLAARLGFGLDHILECNYLSLALEGKL